MSQLVRQMVIQEAWSNKNISIRFIDYDIDKLLTSKTLTRDKYVESSTIDIVGRLSICYSSSISISRHVFEDVDIK